MANWGAVVPIVVAIIGISGFVLPAFAPTFINQIYNKPSILIGIVGSEGEAIINITNSGTIPATNLSLMITANNKIINNITNLISTTNVFLVDPGPRSLLEIYHRKSINGIHLKLHIEKFVTGSGSIIRLAVDSKNAVFKDYSVYATYDQGSTKLNVGEVMSQNSVVSPYAGIPYQVVAEVIVMSFILYKVRVHKKRQFVQRIISEIMNVRKSLRHNPLERHKFEFEPEQKKRPRRRSSGKSGTESAAADTTWKAGLVRVPGWKLDSSKIITGINDYVRVDDFYSKLADRNSSIDDNGGIDDFTLAELNRQCLELAEDALSKVNWSKYGLGR